MRAGRVLLPLQFAEGLPHGLDVDQLEVLAERRQQAGVAERVGQARDAAGVAEDQRIRVRREEFAVHHAGDGEAMADVCAHFLFGERAQVKTQPHALAQLDEFV